MYSFTIPHTTLKAIKRTYSTCYTYNTTETSETGALLYFPLTFIWLASSCVFPSFWKQSLQHSRNSSFHLHPYLSSKKNLQWHLFSLFLLETETDRPPLHCKTVTYSRTHTRTHTQLVSCPLFPTTNLWNSYSCEFETKGHQSYQTGTSRRATCGILEVLVYLKVLIGFSKKQMWDQSWNVILSQDGYSIFSFFITLSLGLRHLKFELFAYLISNT